MLRKKFMADMKRRLLALRRAITYIVIELDVFQLKGNTGGNPFTANAPFRFSSYGLPDTGLDATLAIPPADFLADPSAIFTAASPSRQLTAYQIWFKEQVDAGLLQVAPGFEDAPWTSPYVESAYKKGVVRGYNDTKGLAGQAGPFGQGAQSQFLESAFSGPIGTRQLQLLGTRAFQQLKGVSAAMEQQMSRTLADGLAHGLGPREIARNLNNTVTELGAKRSLVIARTEIINSYAEGQLDSFDMLNVEEVGVMAEWSTAGDDRVCDLCNDLLGVVLTVKEARGLLPRHPNCRCAWLPAMVGEKAAGRKTTQTQIKSSINKSAKGQKGWAGADKTIAKSRTKTPGFDAKSILGKQVAQRALAGTAGEAAAADIAFAPAAGLWEHNPTAVLRWMGTEGFTVEEAAAVMEATGTNVAKATIKTQLNAGIKGTRGAIAALTEEQGAALKFLRSGAVPEFTQAKTGIVRWMGTQDLTFAEAKAVLGDAGIEMADSTIRAQLRAGKIGTRGAPAELTQTQQKWVLSKRAKPGQVSKPGAGVPAQPTPAGAPTTTPTKAPTKAKADAGPTGMDVAGVDASDPFVQEIWAAVGDEGITSAAHAKKVGKLMDKEIKSHPKVKKLQKEIDKANKRLVAIEKEMDGLSYGHPKFNELREEFKELTQKMNGTAYANEQGRFGLIGNYSDAYAEALIETTGRVRSVGGKLNYSSGTTPEMKQVVNGACEAFPTDWVDLINENCTMNVSVVDRGYFGPRSNIRSSVEPSGGTRRPGVTGRHNKRSNLAERGEKWHPSVSDAESMRKTGCHLKLSDRPGVKVRDSVVKKNNGKYDYKGKVYNHRVATHETIHGLEYSAGNKLTQLEYEFLSSRYGVGELPVVFEDAGVRRIVLEDKFHQDYSGKIYLRSSNSADGWIAVEEATTGDELLAMFEASESASAEVATMGVEDILHGGPSGARLMDDDDYREFILGLFGGF